MDDNTKSVCIEVMPFILCFLVILTIATCSVLTHEPEGGGLHFEIERADPDGSKIWVEPMTEKGSPV